LSRINWDAIGSRKYETGVDRGVLYIDGQPGVPWNGLTSIAETAQSTTVKSFYVDGENYLNLASRENYQATLTAYTYPKEFEPCDGVVSVRTGLLLTKQKRTSFGLSYRTMIGNDQSSSYGYKIHLVYNVLASPATKSYKTVDNRNQIDDFSWSLSSVAPVTVGYRRSAHVVIDSTEIDPTILSGIEDILYGTDSLTARLPELSELTDIIDTGNVLDVVDNGDGTFTLTAPIGVLTMLDSSVFQLTWPTAVDNGDGTFTVSS
jgi:hypothetical protein